MRKRMGPEAYKGYIEQKRKQLKQRVGKCKECEGPALKEDLDRNKGLCNVCAEMEQEDPEAYPEWD